MYDSEIGRQVRLSFQALAENPAGFTDADADLLRHRLCAAVDELKAVGWPIEGVIVRIKTLASEVGVQLGNDLHRQDIHPVLAQAVLWCVQQYYREHLVDPT
jgi:hypothetical protein